MGKAFQGVFGSFSGKVGNVVGRILQGEQVYSIYQRNVSNPNTEEQRKQRGKFKILVQTFKVLLSAVRLGFAKLDGYRLGNPFSSAVGFNLKNGLGTSFDAGSQSYILNPETLVISEGSLAPLEGATVTAEGADLIASWNFTGQVGDALDDVFLVALNLDKNIMTMTTEPTTRQGRTATLNVGGSWVGNQAHVWIFAKDKTNMTSMSISLGTLTL